MGDASKRRLFLKLQSEYIKTPPGPGRDELRQKLRELAEEIGRNAGEVGEDLTPRRP